MGGASGVGGPQGQQPIRGVGVPGAKVPAGAEKLSAKEQTGAALKEMGIEGGLRTQGDVQAQGSEIAGTAVEERSGVAGDKALEAGWEMVEEGITDDWEMVETGSVPEAAEAEFQKIDKSSLPDVLPKRMEVELGGHNIHRSILPEIPKGMTEAQVISGINGKIKAGEETLKTVMSAPAGGAGKATVEDMTNIMWFLQVRAEAKTESFSSGAMTMEDPGNKLMNFLGNCTETYQRESSHIGTFKKKGGEYVHRGIDSNTTSAKKMDKLLPHGKQTLLFGRFEVGKGDNQKPMIFMKIEEHGAGLFKPKGGLQKTDTGGEIQHRKRNSHDMGNSIGHGFGFVKSLFRKLRGKQSGAGMRKERIPKKGVKKPFNKLVEMLKEAGKDSLVATLTKGDPLKEGNGIRMVLENLKQIEGEALPKEAQEYVNSMKQYIKDEGLDHNEMRMGREVIFTQEELGLGG